MKKTIFKLILVIAIILIALLLWQPWIYKVVAGEGILLARTDNYIALNSEGSPINAEFYMKKKNLNGEKVNELIVKFNKMAA